MKQMEGFRNYAKRSPDRLVAYLWLGTVAVFIAMMVLGVPLDRVVKQFFPLRDSGTSVATAQVDK